MTNPPRKTSTPRVSRSRTNRSAGMTWIPGFWLTANQTELLAARGVLKEWNTDGQNAEAIAALLRVNLAKLLKR